MNVLIKLLGLVVGMGAGVAANKALEAIWSKSTGKPRRRMRPIWRTPCLECCCSPSPGAR
ncbi:hypothetical protein AHiyo8_57100 [Arthrobacter sp. Hiyo8]|nr:hypothetical protein AHiyo8_57100 [Arthrobacter sp. Hiyo8]